MCLLKSTAMKRGGICSAVPKGHVTFLSLKELKAFLFPMKKKKSCRSVFLAPYCHRGPVCFNKPKRRISLLCCWDHVHFGQLCAIFVFRGLAEKKNEITVGQPQHSVALRRKWLNNTGDTNTVKMRQQRMSIMSIMRFSIFLFQI